MYNGQARAMYGQNSNNPMVPQDRRMYENNPRFNNNNQYPSNYPNPGGYGAPGYPPAGNQGYNNGTKEEPEYFDPRDLPPRNPPSYDTQEGDEYLSPEDRFIKEVKEYNDRLETRVERIDTYNPHNNMMTSRTIELEPFEDKKPEMEELTLERILQKRVIKGGNVEYLQKWRARAKTDKVYQGINESNSWEICWTDNIDGNYYRLANEFEKKSSIDKVEVIKTSGTRKRKNAEDDKTVEEDFKSEEIVEKQDVKCEMMAENRRPLIKQIRRLWVFEEPTQDIALTPVRTGGKGRPPNPLPAMCSRQPASASAPLPQPKVDPDEVDLKDIDNFRTNLPKLFNPQAPISGRAIMELMDSKYGKKAKPE